MKDIFFENGIAYYNWTLLDTADVVQSVYCRFMDGVGNISDIYSDLIILDRTAPTGSVTYDQDIENPTNENVTATLTMTDNFADVDLLNKSHASLDEGKYKYVFNRNGRFEFIISDKAGNKTGIWAEVNNIDKDPPKATVTYSHPRDIWTNESITAQLQLEDENGCVILSEGGDTHTFNENGEFLFEFTDELGNSGSIKAVVKNIDKTPPEGSIIYTTAEMPADLDTAPVTVYLSVNEPVKVTNNEGASDTFLRITENLYLSSRIRQEIRERQQP